MWLTVALVNTPMKLALCKVPGICRLFKWLLEDQEGFIGEYDLRFSATQCLLQSTVVIKTLRWPHGLLHLHVTYCYKLNFQHIYWHVFDRSYRTVTGARKEGSWKREINKTTFLRLTSYSKFSRTQPTCGVQQIHCGSFLLSVYFPSNKSLIVFPLVCILKQNQTTICSTCKRHTSFVIQKGLTTMYRVFLEKVIVTELQYRSSGPEINRRCCRWHLLN